MSALNDSKGRIDYFDIAKAIGMILVIMGHSGFLFDNLKTFFFSFHMALFFVLSGMIICLKNEVSSDMKGLIAKKVKSLMIPYLWFSGLYIIVYIVNVLLGYMSINELLQNVIYMVDMYGDSTLWFIPALLLSEVGFVYLCKRIPDKINLPLTVLIGYVCYGVQLIITPIWARYNDNLLITNLIDFLRGFLRAGVALSFVAIGYYGYKYLNNRFMAGAVKPKWIMRLGYIITGVICMAVTYIVALKNETVDFHRVVLGNYSLFLLCGILGSFGIIFISMGIYKMRLLSFFGINSLIIMCTHLNCYVLYGAIRWAWLVDTIVTRAKSYIFMLNIVIASLVLEAIIIVVINRFLPFMVGKRVVKSE